MALVLNFEVILVCTDVTPAGFILHVLIHRQRCPARQQCNVFGSPHIWMIKNASVLISSLLQIFHTISSEQTILFMSVIHSSTYLVTIKI